MKWNTKIFRAIAVFLFIAVFLVAYTGAEEKSAVPLNQATQSIQVEKKQVPYTTPFVRYKDKEFNLGYFMTYMGESMQNWPKVDPEKKNKVLQDLVKQMVFEHLVYDMAIKDGQDKDPEYLIGNRELEHSWLAYYVAQNLFTKKLMVSDEDIKSRYEIEKPRFFKQAEFSFWHIFTQTVDRNEEQQKKAYAAAEAALALIKAGSDFEEVAKTHSESLNKGQLMGPFKTRQEDPENAINETLEKKLLSLKNGEVSEIIQTKYGYEILKLKEFAPAHYLPVEEVKDTLRRLVAREKEEAWKENFIKEHWQEAVTLYKPELITDEKSGPDTVVLEIYGEKITKESLSTHSGINPQPKKEEKPEDAQKRLEKELKLSVIFGYMATKVGHEAKYDTIPRYVYETGKTRIQKAANFWWKKYLDRNVMVKDVTEEEKKSAFEQYPDYFLKPSLVHAAEMTFKIPEVTAESKYETYKIQNQALEKAKKAFARVKNGEKFEDVAREMSESATAAKGGDLGLISNKSTALPTALVSSVYRMKDGELSDEPVKDGQNYYIIKCIEKPKPESMKIDDPEAQDRIKKVVNYIRGRNFYKEFNAKLVNPDEIKILYPEFATIELNQIEPVSNELPKTN